MLQIFFSYHLLSVFHVLSCKILSQSNLVTFANFGFCFIYHFRNCLSYLKALTTFSCIFPIYLHSLNALSFLIILEFFHDLSLWKKRSSVYKILSCLPTSSLNYVSINTPHIWTTISSTDFVCSGFANCILFFPVVTVRVEHSL